MKTDKDRDRLLSFLLINAQNQRQCLSKDIAMKSGDQNKEFDDHQ
jgi:hypothetical protein